MKLFDGRQILIASMHHKERVIAPILEKYLGLRCIVADINTDKLGTFSGEIDRTLSPLDCAKKKCDWAMEQYNSDLAIASEGSFGPHPQLFFGYCNEEWLVIKDKKNNAEWFAKIISTETNFSSKQCESIEEVHSFCQQIGFPEHAVILRKSNDDFQDIFKGIIESHQLETIAAEFLKKHHSVIIETDMRAMFNPTRMKNIEAAAKKICDQLLNACPTCNFPGFSIKTMNSGLPCSGCGLPTQSIKSSTFSCQKCLFTEDHLNLKKTFEDPMYCNFCNP
jgi:hypothetical protein